MADLLAVEETAIDCFLEGFAKDRVEWLIAADVASRTSKRKLDDLFEPLKRRQKSSLLQYKWCEAKRPKEQRKIRLRPEDMNWQRYAEYFMPR